MSDECYIINTGEIVLLQGLSSNEFNGAVAVVDGVSAQRVVVKLLHSAKTILVKPSNLLEAGGKSGIEKEVPLDLGDDYNSDDASDIGEYHDEIENDENRTEAKHDDLTSLTLAREVLSSGADICLNCKKAIEDNPENWLAYEILGDFYSDTDRDADALQAYTSQTEILQTIYPDVKSSAIIKKITDAFLKIAAIKRRLRDSSRELEALMSISLVDPKNVNVLASIGDLFLDSGDVNKALVYFTAAVSADPSWALGRFHLARILLVNSDSTSAIQELRIAVNECDYKRDDESVERAAKTYMMIAAMIQQIDQSAIEQNLAVKALLRSVNLLSDLCGKTDSSVSVDGMGQGKLLALAYYQLGQLLVKQASGNQKTSTPQPGYYDGAISSYRKSCELDSADSSYKLELGNALRLRAHLKKSKEDLEDSVVVYTSGILRDSGI
jgi:tetratricopeptide (TPR) repeat protein